MLHKITLAIYSAVCKGKFEQASDTCDHCRMGASSSSKGHARFGKDGTGPFLKTEPALTAAATGSSRGPVPGCPRGIRQSFPLARKASLK